MRSFLSIGLIIILFASSWALKSTTTRFRNVILVVRDLDNHASHEFCAVQKFRSPFESSALSSLMGLPIRKYQHHRHSSKYHSLLDMSANAQKCASAPFRNGFLGRRAFVDALHMRFDDFGTCSVNKIIRRVKTNATRMILLGTRDENLV